MLDTHALLFWHARSPKLSRRAAGQMRKADELLVSAVTCWEVATLVAQGRVELDRSLEAWLEDLAADPRVRLVPLSPRAAIEVGRLHAAGFHGDPADRLIYATAIEQMAPLVTADERIHEFAARAHPAVQVLW